MTWAAKDSYCVAWFFGARWALWLRARAGTPIHAHTRAAMAAFEKAAQL